MSSLKAINVYTIARLKFKTRQSEFTV